MSDPHNDKPHNDFEPTIINVVKILVFLGIIYFLFTGLVSCVDGMTGMMIPFGI